jgi:hypothetical protein
LGLIISGAVAAVAIVAIGLAVRADRTPQVRAQQAPRQQPQQAPRVVTPAGVVALARTAKGTDSRGIPLYIARSYSPAERTLLRSAFGVDEPQRLYFSDSSDMAILKYDTQAKRCRACYVDSYRVGFLSIRHPGEAWDAFDGRVRRMRPQDFPVAAHRIHTSLDDLDPGAKPAFEALLDAGRRAGFRLAVIETYRTPVREALFFEEGHGRTFTATSMHSYGRAVDIAVDDGIPAHAATRADWIRFRQLVTVQANGRFRLLGSVEHTWDWRHVELPAPEIGFHSIDDALAFAAHCTSNFARAHGPTSARLGGAASDACVFVPHLPILRGPR